MRYPLFLDLAKQPVVVVGAGKVAVRKIRTLLAAGAAITVISPAASAPICRWAEAKRLQLVNRPYRAGDLVGAALVIAATNDLPVNERVCLDARRKRILVNCVAPPAAGNFIVPSSVRRGGITLAISTNGTSPAFAKQLRRDLERFLNRGYVGRLRTMSAARRVKKIKQ